MEAAGHRSRCTCACCCAPWPRTGACCSSPPAVHDSPEFAEHLAGVVDHVELLPTSRREAMRVAVATARARGARLVVPDGDKNVAPLLLALARPGRVEVSVLLMRTALPGGPEPATVGMALKPVLAAALARRPGCGSASSPMRSASSCADVGSRACCRCATRWRCRPAGHRLVGPRLVRDERLVVPDDGGQGPFVRSGWASSASSAPARTSRCCSPPSPPARRTTPSPLCTSSSAAAASPTSGRSSTPPPRPSRSPGPGACTSTTACSPRTSSTPPSPGSTRWRSCTTTTPPAASSPRRPPRCAGAGPRAGLGVEHASRAPGSARWPRWTTPRTSGPHSPASSPPTPAAWRPPGGLAPDGTDHFVTGLLGDVTYHLTHRFLGSSPDR